MKKYIRLICLLWICLFVYKSASSQIDLVPISLLEGATQIPYNANTVKEFRSNNSLAIGKIQVKNKTDAPLTVLLYHSDAPGRRAQYIFELKKDTVQILTDNQNKPLIIGNDWGIQLKQKKWTSDIFFVENISLYQSGTHLTGFKWRLIPYSEEYEKSMPKTLIGTQTWTSTNLEIRRFRNGDIIPYYESFSDWKEATEKGEAAAFRVLKNLASDAEKSTNCGYLYNWYAVTDPRGLAPEGWHIPSASEWETLINYLGGSNEAARKMKDPNTWWDDEKEVNNFLAQICISLENENDRRENFRRDAYWWSTTKRGTSEVYVFGIFSASNVVKKLVRGTDRVYTIRLVKD